MKAVDIMHVFDDFYNNRVTLSLADHPFSNNPRHVWVICQYRDDWLLTKHKERGLEFPGGKVEMNENPREAARREVKEETGGEVTDIYYVGQYSVSGKTETIVKNIYFAIVDSLLEQTSYFETEGPITLKQIPHDIKNNKHFSFIMKDDVLTYALDFVQQKGLKNRP